MTLNELEYFECSCGIYGYWFASVIETKERLCAACFGMWGKGFVA